MDRANGGVIFRNNYKQTDAQPDWKGEAEYNGQKFEVALWEKKDKNGKTFFSVKTSAPYQKDQQQPKTVSNLDGFDNEKDPLPF